MPLFRRTAGFCRFLRANDNIIELSGSDLEIVLHFAKRMGPVAGLSKAYFNEHDKIVVTEGPLTGLEGLIIKVDKRKGRAKIKLDFCDEAFTVDLGFEVMETKKA
jgi:transcriptional antiterminator NusG